jgi:hypothetical protein
MTRKTLTALAALVLLVAATSPLRAYDPLAHVGTWTRTATIDDHEVKIKLEVKDNTIRCTIHTTEGPVASTLTVEADYLVTKDGVLVGVLRGGKKPQKGAGKEDPKDSIKDRVFACHFTIEKGANALVVTEVVSGGDADDMGKKVLEGKFHRVKTAPRAATAGTAPVQPPCPTSN